MTDKEKTIEKSLKSYCEWCMAQGGNCHAMLNGCSIADTLALVKQEPCSLCGGNLVVPENQGHNTIVEIPCPKCQEPCSLCRGSKKVYGKFDVKEAKYLEIPCPDCTESQELNFIEIDNNGKDKSNQNPYKPIKLNQETLTCPGCTKQFPLFMAMEYQLHVDNCKNPPPDEPESQEPAEKVEPVSNLAKRILDKWTGKLKPEDDPRLTLAWIDIQRLCARLEATEKEKELFRNLTNEAHKQWRAEVEQLTKRADEAEKEADKQYKEAVKLTCRIMDANGEIKQLQADFKLSEMDVKAKHKLVNDLLDNKNKIAEQVSQLQAKLEATEKEIKTSADGRERLRQQALQDNATVKYDRKKCEEAEERADEAEKAYDKRLEEHSETIDLLTISNKHISLLQTKLKVSKDWLKEAERTILIGDKLLRKLQAKLKTAEKKIGDLRAKAVTKGLMNKGSFTGKR